jgi:CHAD domain-containing protein
MYQLYDDRLADGVRRIVQEQIDSAIAELRGQTDGSRDEEVHEARKRCKRLRALLRLVRDRLGVDLYRYENVAIRDAARRVAPVRDAHVLVLTLDDVVDTTDQRFDAAAVSVLRAELKAAHDRLRRQMLYRGTACDQAADDLAAVRERSHEWPLDGVDLEDLRSGLARVYRRGRRRMTEAYGAPSPERFHEWRKRVKYLWHHLELLQPAWPRPLDALARETHGLSDLLGDEHDRTVLEEWLRQRPDAMAAPHAARELTAALDEQRAHLRAAARQLGAKIYAESPERFTGRLSHYWSVGRVAA